MRILRVAQTYYPDVTGGGAYHVHAMSRDQAAMGHDVTVLTLRRSPDAPRREERDGYTVVRRDPTLNVIGNEISAGLVRELWGAKGFDVVHAHSHLYFATNVAALKRRVGETPLAITNHGLYSQSAPRWLFDLYLRTLGRATFDSADVMFCYTETDERRVREFGVSADIAIVPNGIDTGRFTPDGPSFDGVAGDPTILFVGRLVDGKRPTDALRAFERVYERHPAARLTFCGDGPLRDQLEREVDECGLDGAVRFLGHVSYDDMPSVYRAADVLVLPSESEGFPRTVLEALASGTPVVATALDQLLPLRDHGVETVPLGDAPAIASAIESLGIEGRDESPDGRSYHQFVADQYDWTDTVTETTDRLVALAESTSSRSE
ncbi:glycosyltransferase family 4 protein [Halosimplex salinum]|uniref:glycosyltransferase family 4 protein n=1 Tax=Halosimplex salinum TaxID=1710538 RepID=UPI000F47AC6D|nr:glycosyltransferase family 4 protein [Halosimplex salinum]